MQFMFAKVRRQSIGLGINAAKPICLFANIGCFYVIPIRFGDKVG